MKVKDLMEALKTLNPEEDVTVVVDIYYDYKIVSVRKPRIEHDAKFGVEIEVEKA